MNPKTNQDDYRSFGESRYSDYHVVQKRSPLLDQIYRGIYGDDYPAETEPLGFVTRFDLQWIAEHLNLRAGHTLLDVGCGQGGPGLWVAQETRAKLIGIDIEETAFARARALAKHFDLRKPAKFRGGSFTETGLEEASVRGVMSVETLWMVLNKHAALAEIHRVLKPGSRFVFVTWVAPYIPYPDLLSSSGFELLAEQESPQWKERQLAVYQEILENREALRGEMGTEAANVLISEAEHAPEGFAEGSRVLFAARRLG